MQINPSPPAPFPPAPSFLPPSGSFSIPNASVSTLFAKPTGFGHDGFDAGAIARVSGAAATSGATTVGRLVTQSATVAIRESLVKRLASRAAWLAVPIAAVGNFLDFQAGTITAQQRNTLIAADAVGYTAAGFAGTFLATALGATGAPGLVVGLVGGAGAAWLYERFARPRFDSAPPPHPFPPPK
jgi:hypothetical protein